jgi:hypothetical protein
MILLGTALAVALRADAHMSIVGPILVALSLIPLLFLAYSLLNLEKLGIKRSHPRVLVESALFLLLFLSGALLCLTP